MLTKSDKLIARSKDVKRRVAALVCPCHPLSVYMTQGYNMKDIEEKCKDAMEHPVLGNAWYLLPNLHSRSFKGLINT